MIYLLCANRREYCIQNENGINHVVLLSSHDDIARKENTATRHLILSCLDGHCVTIGFILIIL